MAVDVSSWSPATPSNRASPRSTRQVTVARTTPPERGAIGGVVIGGDQRFQRDPGLVSTDFTGFADAVADRRRAVTDEDREYANRAVVAHYTGPLADGLSSDWIDTVGESLRRDALDAAAGLAKASPG
jgi:hypothetical protein